MRDLAVLIPTRGRPENVRKVVSAWDFTNAWDDADMVLVIDQDDPEISGYRALESDLRHPDTDEPLIKLYEVPVWVPMVHKLNQAAAALAPGWFALAFAGDDHLPQTIGWAARYLTVLHELGSGMVYGDDGYQGVKLSTEWAITSDVVRELGRMVPADVEHMYCDNAMMDLFAAAGALRHLPEVRIEHMHPVAGKAKTDAQYQRVNHRNQFSKDGTAYRVWREGETFTMQVAAVRQLRQGRAEIRPPKPAEVKINRRTHGRIANVKPPRFFKRVRAATPEDVMVALADFATQVPADQEIVELGVFQGRTALQMAWAARLGHGAHVTGIDPWSLEGNVYDPPFTDDGSRRWANHWVQSLGYTRDITLINDFSHNVAERWEGKPVGLLYVDGDHTKDGARRDIETWARHLAPGARIAVDDYGHPDWPGVGEAVDELVAEGFLEPIELFHDRLAVTRLAEKGEPRMEPTGKVTAITSEGVSTSPYPAVGGQAAVGPEQVPEKAEPALTPSAEIPQPWPDEEEPVAVVDAGIGEAIAAVTDNEVSSRERVSLGEAIQVEGTSAGQPIEELNTTQLRALAKVREIKLGVRKDKRDAMLAALRDGR